MRPFTVALVVLSALVGIPGSADAVAPPDSCQFDPAYGDSGLVTTDIPQNDYQFGRSAIDAQGRVVISSFASNTEHFVDRIYRMLPDGALDTSFGSGGYVDVPNPTFSDYTRNVEVDELGRIWYLRAADTNEVTLQRFNADGSYDTGFGAYTWEFPAPQSVDPFGDLEAGADGAMTAAFGVYSLPPDQAGIAYTVFGADGSVADHSIAPGTPGEFWVFDVGESGIVAGQVKHEDGRYPMLWHPEWDGVAVHDLSGTYDGTQTVDGNVIAFGRNWVGDELAQILVSEIGPAGEQVRSVISPQPDWPFVVIHDIRPDGRWLGAAYNGTDVDASRAQFATGRLNADLSTAVGELHPRLFQVILGPGDHTTVSGVDRSVAPVQAVGSTGELAIVQLTPELGPVAQSGALSDQLRRLYSAYFLRAPDGGGLSYWRGQRAQGMALAAVSAEFAQSDEFQQRYGALDNEQFVDQVYQNVLGRPGDVGGRDFWLSLLNGNNIDRGALMVEFSESPEYIQQTATIAPHDEPTGGVFRLYDAYFQRAPDAEGSCFWVRRIVGGAPLDDVSQAFAAAPEFSETYGSLDNRQFVQLVYRNVLGRQGEASGVDYWTGLLNTGQLNRGQVMTGFSESPEYLLRTDTLPG